MNFEKVNALKHSLGGLDIIFTMFIKEDKKRSEMRGKTRENINVSLLELTKSAEV